MINEFIQSPAFRIKPPEGRKKKMKIGFNCSLSTDFHPNAYASSLAPPPQCYQRQHNKHGTAAAIQQHIRRLPRAKIGGSLSIFI
jgi:hypothetical protein